jgi:integrase/recombinase XerC/integrase/recombinase XerD
MNLYIHVVEKFAAFLEKLGNTLENATSNDVISYINSLSNSASTKRTYRAALMSFAKMVKGTSIVTDEIPTIKSTSQELPKVMTRDQIDNIVGVCATIRDKCIIRLSYELALRSGEAAALKRGDVDLTGRTVTVRAEKGGITMQVPIVDGSTIQLLDLYMSNTTGSDEDALFPSGKTGSHMNSSSVSAMFRDKADALGIDHVFHALRHSRATHLIRDGADIYTVSKLLRHQRIDTTMVYVHLAQEDLRAKLNQHAKPQVDAIQNALNDFSGLQSGSKGE